jgi:hypothetical protein
MSRESPLRVRAVVPWFVVLLAAVTVGLGVVLVNRTMSVEQRAGEPPPPDGYFTTEPVGGWRELPGDSECAERVHRSTWEPRPENFRPNHRPPDAAAVRAAFEERPRARMGAYHPRWDRWLLPRVSGQFTGTTDEIIQWAACKWGLADNLLRAVALRESGWYQGQTYSDGTCVLQHGCGDLFTEPRRGAHVFCRQVARVAPEVDDVYGRGNCPRTFSLVGVMSWQDPRWGRMPGNQNGTFPFNRQSTAFALDYVGGFVRGCYEGWMVWLENTGDYRRGDLLGCVGAWYGGAWHSPLARGYTGNIERALEERPWLDPEWARQTLPCDTERGCPTSAP